MLRRRATLGAALLVSLPLLFEAQRNIGWLVLAGAGAPTVTRVARVVGFSWRWSAGRDAGGSGGWF